MASRVLVRVKEPKTDNGIITWGSKTYGKRMMENFNKCFGFEPSKQHARIPPDYKTEIDTTVSYKDAEKEQYWQCIVDI